MTNLGASGYGSELRVQVGGVGELVHDEVAQVVEERMFVHGVLHFRYLRQVLDIKPFTLSKKTAYFNLKQNEKTTQNTDAISVPD